MKTFKVKVKTNDASVKVGLFFVIGGKLESHLVELRDAEEYQGVYNDTLSHNDLYYHYIAPKYGFSQRSDWEQYPRGRVVAKTMANGTKKYYVFMDKCILYKADIRNQILNDFGIPLEATVWKTDSHYKCANCGANVGFDFDDDFDY